MSHNLLENDIQIGVEQAWHSLSTVRSPILLSEVPEVRYEMETRPLFCEINGTKVETGFKQIVALDKNIAVGNPVGTKYSLISNNRILDMIMEATSNVPCEVVSVGTVMNRALFFVSLKLKDSDARMARRETTNILNILSGHGGNQPLVAKTTNVVTVCNNTFNVNMATKSDFSLKLRHSLNAHDKLTNFAECIDAHYGAVAEFKAAMDAMANKKCDETRATRIAAGILGNGKELSTRTANTVNRITQLFIGGSGNKGRDLADLFNAQTDFYSHESRGGDSQFRQYVSSEFGSASKAKQEWFDVLTNEDKVKEVAARGAKSLELTMAN